MKSYGKLPRSRFSLPVTRGGGFNPNKEPEPPLTGKVQNLKAAQGEERLSRTIQKGINKGIVAKHIFRWTTAPRATQTYKELDSLVVKTNGEVVAISVKGATFVHRNSSDKEQDKINEIIILKTLREKGYNVSEIKTVFAEELKTQEGADNVGRRLGIYR